MGYLRADGSSYKILAQDDSSHLSTPMGGGVGDLNDDNNGLKETEGLGSFMSVPMSKLCSRGQPWQHDNYLLGSSKFTLTYGNDKIGGEQFNRGTYGWCRALDPPGFFAVVYFDDCSADGVSYSHGVFTSEGVTAIPAAYAANSEMCGLGKTGFRIMTRPAVDYATTTRFHVFTTKGTLQQVSAHAAAYTQSRDELYEIAQANADGDISKATMNPNFIHGFHSNVIHTTNTTWEGGVGAVDCETAPVGTYGNLDCLSKGDKIFLVNLGARDTNNCMTAPSHSNIAGSDIDATNCFYA